MFGNNYIGFNCQTRIGAQLVCNIGNVDEKIHCAQNIYSSKFSIKTGLEQKMLNVKHTGVNVA